MNRHFLTLSLLFLATVCAVAQQSPQMLAKPKQGYVLDKAGLLTNDAEAKVNRISVRSNKESQSPIYVVTIPSLKSVHGFDIVTYANELFDAWGVGTRQLNKGILLLVSKGDRKARIALGAGWRYDRDGECEAIMSTSIVPRFKQGDYSGGIVAGSEALAAMVKKPKSSPKAYSYSGPPDEVTYGFATPAPNESFNPVSTFLPMLICPVGFFVMIIVIAIANGGGGGYRGGTWYGSNSSWGSSGMHHHHHSSGGFSSGSSSSSSSSHSSGGGGGGYSGGGGATGSW